MLVIGKLKTNKRTGWVRKNIDEPESIADHMYRMAVLAFLLPDAPGVRRDHCIKLALVHDMAESLVGDITPHCGVGKEEKHRLEEAAMGEIRALLGPRHQSVGEELYSLWLEYERASTAEARLVKDLDKFEMILQAYEYETHAVTPQTSAGETDKRHPATPEDPKPFRLDDFFDSVRGKIKSETVRGWESALRERRANRVPPNAGSEGAAATA